VLQRLRSTLAAEPPGGAGHMLVSGLPA